MLKLHEKIGFRLVEIFWMISSNCMWITCIDIENLHETFASFGLQTKQKSIVPWDKSFLLVGLYIHILVRIHTRIHPIYTHEFVGKKSIVSYIVTNRSMWKRKNSSQMEFRVCANMCDGVRANAG